MARGFRRTRVATVCPRCDRMVEAGQPYVLRKGRAIHPGCAPGGDE